MRLHFDDRPMSKAMTLDVLSSIKGAKASESVNQLFENIKSASLNQKNTNTTPQGVSLDSLREDTVILSSAEEKNLIKENFPKEKNGYLVVQKVID